MYGKDEALSGVSKMDRDTVEMMLCQVLRVPGMLERASTDLKPELFTDAGEAPLRLLWTTALQLFKDYGQVTYASLMGEIRQLSVDDEDLLTEGQWKELTRNKGRSGESPGVIYWMYLICEEHELDINYAEKLLKQFLYERAVYSRLDRALGNGEKLPENLRDIVYDVARVQEQIEAIGADVDISPFPETIEIDNIEYRPLGVSWIDRIIGGLAGGERFGIIGPYESGKTMLAVQLATEGARSAQLNYDRGIRDVLAHWYMFEYEQAVKPHILNRVWSYAAQIPRNRIDTLKSRDDLSTSGNWMEYEKKKFARQIQADPNFPGERERFDTELKRLNRNLHLVDMSGGRNQGTGMGGIREIAGILEKNYRYKKQRPGGVVIDYALLMIRRQMRRENIDTDKLRHHVAEVADETRRLICDRYDIPAIIFHQFTGEVNKRLPGADINHADAAEAKNFAENMDVVMCLGNKDPQTRVCRAIFTKARRERASGEHTLLLVDGKFSRMVCVDNRYVINKARRIVPKADADQFHGMVAAPPGASQRPSDGYSRSSSYRV